MSNNIDVVITWVDGNDPKHKAKLNSCLGNKNRDIIPGASETRFGSVNEIKYCVLSILKFAPFVRKIFIITDNQDPNLENDINTYFPERLKDIQIIDHKEIFKDYEHFLPTFNARSIAPFAWRIKDLADKFVYFNDDLFLLKPIEPEDWFIDGKPILRGRWRYRPLFLMLKNKLLKNFKRIFLQINEPNFNPIHKVSVWRGAEIVGFKLKYLKTDHTPHPIDRLRLEEYFNKHISIFVKNTSYKFRHYNQFDTISLANHLEIKDENVNIEFLGSKAVYLEPVNVDANYTDKNIKKCSREESKYMCAQNLDLAAKIDREKILSWLEENLKK